jgi:zinc protease
MLIEKVYKKVLANGLSILVVPNHQIPKVSVQLWYNVGAKDEKSSQKGIAHLIEHMIFKGTKTLSESDINLITQKLSGYCNAFTSNDYTGYLFDFPSQHWQEALPIMADCMRNCTFREELLNSELKAVIQELKMYNDDYISLLIEKMLGAIFTDHPYRYPIIGYKRDLWALKREELINFYHKHYIPNNAALVVVGDVDAEDVFVQAERYFGEIPPDPSYAKEQFYHVPDIEATSVVLHRDVQQPMAMVAWVLPGMQEKQDYILDLMSWIIGAGKGSRLYKKIVDDLALATELDSFVYDLFEKSIFFVQFQPKEGVDPEKIISVITQEMNELATHGPTASELVRAIKKTEMDALALRENNQKLAYLIAKYFIALGDESYLSFYNAVSAEELPGRIQDLVSTYLRPTVMHRGFVLPLPEVEKKFWLEWQERSDEEDALVLSRITREAEVEDGMHVENIHVIPPKDFKFPQAESLVLPNGLKVLFHHNPNQLKIDLVLDFKAKYFFDPEDRQGLSTFLFDMLQEGTTHYNSQQFSHELDSLGMSLNTFPGHITMTMLAADAYKGLYLLSDMLMHALLDDQVIEKVRTRLLSDVIDFWDDPAQFVGELVREKVYAGHPYRKRVLGSVESIRAITKADLVAAYKRYITPKGSRLAIVGDLSQFDLRDLLETTIGSWQGAEEPTIEFPAIFPAEKATEINYPINRDQITLCFGRLSVDRKNPDFDKLLLFDQVFSGGVLGSMSSRLFALREQSGLFYTIGGSLLAGSGQQPGMLFIKTIVSNDRLAEAERQIKAVIDAGAKDLTQEEHEEAQRAVINSLVDNFATNAQMATTFLFLDLFGFPKDYFDTRVKNLLKVTRQEVQEAAARLLCSDALVTVRAGRGL